jgi:hypothetical protein
MEVHHHPELPHGEKKRFKEYLLEFLMIFLAVTMGFIAENIREHLSDNSKETEYIEGMIKDLSVDTSNLTFTINRNHTQLSGIDTLTGISKGKLSDLKVQDSLYQYTITYLFNENEFKNDDVTLSQLRNSGGYRLIRRDGVADSLELYEKSIQFINEQQSYYATSVNKTVELSASIFDLNNYRNFHLSPSSTPMVITNNKDLINSFYNRCFLISVSLKGYNQMLKYQRSHTKTLITFLKKEYDVD